MLGSMMYQLLPEGWISSVLFTVLYVGVLIAALGAYSKFVAKMPFPDFRVKKPSSLAIWIVCAIVLPVLVSGFYLLFVPGTLTKPAHPDGYAGGLIISAIFGVGLAAGIAEEFLFRGYLMRLLEKQWGLAVAVLIPSVLFGVAHIFNIDAPNAVDIIMLIVAGTSVGVMFSMIAVQSGSIWPGAIVHGLWNIVILGNILYISPHYNEASLFSYQLSAESTLITGGAFGIESAVPGTICYLLVALIVFLLWKKRRVSPMMEDEALH
jgi:hypothetical protein